MDFATILQQWENSREGRGQEPLKGEPTAGEDPQAGGQRQSRYQRLRDREPQARLDLHGLSASEAQTAVERFLSEADARALGKVLIIHGKGHHSHGKPILDAVVRACLERSPLAGAFGRAEPRHGGRGATWVILREALPGGSRSYRSL